MNKELFSEAMILKQVSWRRAWYFQCKGKAPNHPKAVFSEFTKPWENVFIQEARQHRMGLTVLEESSLLKHATASPAGLAALWM